MYKIIVADPAYQFNDRLTMSEVKRGAEAQYKSVLSMEDIKNLPVKYISANDAVLALWVPSSMLHNGLEIMKAWGFEYKQNHIWVKVKRNPISFLLKSVFGKQNQIDTKDLSKITDDDLTNILAFYMGRLFRQTHEIAIIGVKGKVYNHLKNKSQRSVHFCVNDEHSAKPEALQNMLVKMFPEWTGKDSAIELFARRDRSDYLCFGNECPSTEGRDIRNCMWELVANNPKMIEKSGLTEEQVKELVKIYENVST